jgi:hypothetical protein
VREAPGLPGDVVCARADLVACNGGSLGVQQALAAARPVIANDLGPAPARAEGAKSAAATPSVPASTPLTPAYSGTGAVKAEYARAGQWKARPGEAPATQPALTTSE